MNLTQLKCFIAVAETLSFTKASKQLNFVQSAVSSNVAELENQLGVELFVRTNRFVRLTDIGEQILSNAYRIIALVDDCRIKCDRFQRGITGNLMVGYVFSPTMRSVLHLFEDFTAARPEVNIQLRSYPDEKLAQACIENEADLLATCPNSVSGHLDTLAYKPLFTEKYKVVMNKVHHLAGEKLLSVEQLCTENFCVMDRRINTGLYGDIITMCTKANFAPRVVSESNAMTGLLLNLEMNQGLTILPSSWQKRVLNSDRLAFVDLEGSSTERVVGLAWSKSNANPALKLFLSEMKWV